MAYAKVNGINIYYEIRGDREGAETVAFFNGVMSSVRSWDVPVSVLERFGFKIFLHDFRGQLLSEKPTGQYTFSMHAKDAKGLLDHLGINCAHIIGTSYGGIVGLRFALDFPESVKSLALIDTSTELDGFFKWIGSRWIGLAKQGDLRGLYDNAVPIIYSRFYVERSEDEIKERGALLEKVPGDFLNSLALLLKNTMENTRLTTEISGLKCPVLVVCGENDLLTPVKSSKIIYENIPQAEFLIIPECGHAAIYEKPEAIGSVVLGFVAKHSEEETSKKVGNST